MLRGAALDILIIILILVGVIVLYFATRFLGKTFKIVTKVLLLLILILLVLIMLVYKDMNDLRKGFSENNNTFFLYDDGKLYSAVTLKPMTSAHLGIDSFNYFKTEDVSEIEQALNNKEYDALFKNNYRIFILRPDILNKSYKLKLGAELNQNDLLEIIMSNNSFLILAEKTQESYGLEVHTLRKGLKDMYGDEEKIKGYLFAALLANYFQTQNPGELIMNIKEKNLLVRPESISFKIIRYLPWSG